ncbi:UNKEMPT FAMILY MEMBER [Salix viminalis]|uniref:UNKEMPT FAMILY MEMBER n=1 Tax=Salix viminalis TaxID=40686 RepID=A0A9Q0YXY8_SALVM|nr:UNKEMPT FAMILY MEMBER [Salix viminalis]
MLKGVNPNHLRKCCNSGENPFSVLKLTPTQYDSIDDEIYSTDEFRMYAYKIKKCSRTRSHDWTECPYAHRGEKATRRDPRKVPYTAIACPAFRSGQCLKGDECESAHGVFEYWLHPSRYRTRACNAGRFCQRKVCFFAHTPEQLRSQNKHTCPLVYRARMNGHENGILGFGSSSEDGASSCPMLGSPVAMIRMDGGSYFDGVSDFLINSLRNSKILDENDHDQEIRGLDESSGISGLDLELPHIDWISELVK